MSDCGRVAGVHDEAIADRCTVRPRVYAVPVCVHGAVLDLGCMGECVRFTNALPVAARSCRGVVCVQHVCVPVARRRKSSMFFKTTLYPSIGVRSNGTLRTATS